KRAPEEEREAGREVDVGHTVDPPGSRGVRLLFEPEDEVRARQDRFERGPKAAFETTWLTSPTRSAPGRALLVERHQAIDLAARERPIVRTNQVLVRAIEAPDERGGHALLTRADEDRLGPNQPGPASVRTARGSALVFQQRDPLAVDGEVDVLEPRVGSGAQR